MDEPQISESGKEHNKIADMSSKDFIDRLPDEILIEILSHVPTKSAVATSVLSKRWNRMWISVPSLDFLITMSPVKQTHFSNFVTRVLSLNKVSCLRKFHLNLLYLNQDCDSLRSINEWMSDIAKRDSMDINLQLPTWCLTENFYRTNRRICLLPCRFFFAKNLATLSFKHVPLKVPTLVNFPCLKTIHLISVHLLDQVSMKNLLSGCQILHLLWIDRPSWDNEDTLYICSSTLQHLILRTQDCGEDFGSNVVIDAPKLRDITLSNEIGVNYDIINLTSLVKVEVDIELSEEELEDVEDFNIRLLELLRKISHVEDMHFTTATMRSFMYANDEMPTFHNLTRMKVDICDESGSMFGYYLFECAPNLVTFVLQIDDTELHAWYAPDEVPKCFLSSLEYVEIKSFNVCDNEMRLINYILKHALVLKKLVIGPFDFDDLEEEMKILTTLFLIPRSSRFCQIEYRNSISPY